MTGQSQQKKLTEIEIRRSTPREKCESSGNQEPCASKTLSELVSANGRSYARQDVGKLA